MAAPICSMCEENPCQMLVSMFPSGETIAVCATCMFPWLGVMVEQFWGIELPDPNPAPSEVAQDAPGAPETPDTPAEPSEAPTEPEGEPEAPEQPDPGEQPANVAKLPERPTRTTRRSASGSR